jgi:outer membrane lipoprotein SlyB
VTGANLVRGGLRAAETLGGMYAGGEAGRYVGETVGKPETLSTIGSFLGALGGEQLGKKTYGYLAERPTVSVPKIFEDLKKEKETQIEIDNSD